MSRPSDDAFLTAFREATLPSSEFTHEAHLRLAWLHLSRSSADQAILDVQDQIRHYAVSLGAAKKFHSTLTVASMKLVQERMRKATYPDFEAFLSQHPELMTGFKELIRLHYSEERLASQEARMHYLEPDLAPFDIL